MNNCIFYFGADTPALQYAKSFLQSNNCVIAPAPSPDVTHLILNVPAFTPDSRLIGGTNISDLLEKLPENVTVIGGNLNNNILRDYSTWDLLQNESYLAENAAITAECALRVALPHLTTVIRGTPVLILGWGRIAKCLAKLMHSTGGDVTVAARKEADIAIANALGYNAVPLNRLRQHLIKFHIVFNTVPAMILSDTDPCRPDCLKIDLASFPGIAGNNVISARGLPGKLAPESAGQLIAKTILKLCSQKEAIT